MIGAACSAGAMVEVMLTRYEPPFINRPLITLQHRRWNFCRVMQLSARSNTPEARDEAQASVKIRVPDAPPVSQAKSLRVRWNRFSTRALHPVPIDTSRTCRASLHVLWCRRQPRVAAQRSASSTVMPRHPMSQTHAGNGRSDPTTAPPLSPEGAAAHRNHRAIRRKKYRYDKECLQCQRVKLLGGGWCSFARAFHSLQRAEDLPDAETPFPQLPRNIVSGNFIVLYRKYSRHAAPRHPAKFADTNVQNTESSRTLVRP